jgi:hypothetical protein
MPALARKHATEEYEYGSIATQPARKSLPRERWHDGARPSAPTRTARVRGAHARVAPRREAEDVNELLSHFGHGNAELQERERAQLEAKHQERKRERRRHRPFHMSAPATVIVLVPLFLLASLLWLRSSSLALSRHDAKLQQQIEETRFDLQRTRKEIALLAASPQAGTWAQQRGWRVATQSDFDQMPAEPLTEVAGQSTPIESANSNS